MSSKWLHMFSVEYLLLPLGEMLSHFMKWILQVSQRLKDLIKKRPASFLNNFWGPQVL